MQLGLCSLMIVFLLWRSKHKRVQSAKHMVKSKTKSVSNQGAFSNFSKTKRSLYNFLKFLHEIEAAAAICFVIVCGRRKSQQNSRIHVRGQKKLVYPVWNLSDSSKSRHDQKIKGVWRCPQSRLLFPDLARKDRSDSASRVSHYEWQSLICYYGPYRVNNPVPIYT